MTKNEQTWWQTIKDPEFRSFMLYFMVVSAIVGTTFFWMGQQTAPTGYVLVEEMIYLNKTIDIDRGMMDYINNMWLDASNDQRERGICLNVEGNVITSHDGYLNIGTKEQLRWDHGCRDVSIHTHFGDKPGEKGACILSPLDAIYFYLHQKRSETDYMMIICDVDKVTLFDFEDMQRTYEVNVINYHE